MSKSQIRKASKRENENEFFDDPSEYRKEDNRKRNHNHREDRKEKLAKRYEDE